ncbi:hypothetical protein ACH427_01765 [Streptomyces sp. NPDC020379]|uniref:hypothetical protein n=1 Tax=Streptomyces sp. NPDC020379 TaxID=3365071 RepID=UPI0037AF5BED
MADSERSQDRDDDVSGLSSADARSRSAEVPSCHCHEERNRGVASLWRWNRLIVEALLWIIRFVVDTYGTGE